MFWSLQNHFKITLGLRYGETMETVRASTTHCTKIWHITIMTYSNIEALTIFIIFFSSCSCLTCSLA